MKIVFRKLATCLFTVFFMYTFLLTYSIKAEGLPSPPQTDESRTTITLWHPLPNTIWTSQTGFLHIQSAINASAKGDVIVVPPGTYTESLIINHDLIVTSVKPENSIIVSQTILNAGDLSNSYERPAIVSFASSISEHSLLSGFTICNHVQTISSSVHESPIEGHGSKAVISHNVIRSNNNYNDVSFVVPGEMPPFNGAIHDCDGLIANNVFHHNIANKGGALSDCDGPIFNNYFVENDARDIVESITGHDPGSFTAFIGKGSAFFNCQGPIVNNTIYTIDNYHSLADDCHGTFLNNIVKIYQPYGGFAKYVTQNTAQYCCIPGLVASGKGNLNEDPAFASTDIIDGRTPLSSASPCIDAGMSTTSLTLDYEGDRRGYAILSDGLGDGSHTDIGADEFVPHGEITVTPPLSSDLRIKRGGYMDVNLKMEDDAGTSAELTLFLSGALQAQFGPFSISSSGMNLSIALPANLRIGTDYNLRVTSILDPRLFSDSTFFGIYEGGLSDVTPKNWLVYR